MWLDQDEFGSVTEYLKHELYSMHSKEFEHPTLARLCLGAPRL
jgi:hypothetical protein